MDNNNKEIREETKGRKETTDELWKILGTLNNPCLYSISKEDSESIIVYIALRPVKGQVQLTPPPENLNGFNIKYQIVGENASV